MHTLLFTMIAISGVNGHTHHTGPHAHMEVTSEACCEEGCTHGGCSSCHAAKDPKCSIMGPMPQTCYAPNYGCYSGNERYTNRYPAFHGTHYRKAYNYRNYFDYPWHAEPHEPTSMFSYSTETDGTPTQHHGTHPEVPAPPMPMARKENHTPSTLTSAKVKPASTTFSSPLSEPKSMRNLRR